MDDDIRQMLTMIREESIHNYRELSSRMNELKTDLVDLDIFISNQVISITKEALKHAKTMPVGGAAILSIVSAGFVGLLVYIITHLK